MQRQLHFYLDQDAPPAYRRKWRKFCKKMYSDIEWQQRIVQIWMDHHQEATGERFPWLDRCEGGIGGNNNTTDKQLRFHQSLFRCDICMLVCDPDTKSWDRETLAHLVRSFCLACEDYMETECVSGCISYMVQIKDKFI
jgi:hypothetical protein